MEDISLHLMDLIENSLMAGASLVEIGIHEDPAEDQLEISIQDNGRGMDQATQAKALDPFFTTRTTRRVGLGLSLMKANAQAWGGDLELNSEPGQGTKVRLWCQLSHIDRQPLGDWPQTLAGLIMSRPEADFSYQHQVGEDEFELDTRELKEELGAEALSSVSVAKFLEEQMSQALATLGSRA